VFTDAERSSLMSAPTGDHRTEPINSVARAQPRYIEKERRGSVGRWLIAVAVLAVLTVVVTLAINMMGGDTRNVAVPDVSGKVSADAIAELQNRGFRTRTQQKPDSTVPPDHVIGTDPAANSSVEAGDEITLSVSTGPEQREIPDVRNLSYDDAVEKLTDAGFENFRPSSSPSTPEMKDKVLGTNPPVNQTSAITNEITIVLGAGPETRPVPDVKGQSQESAVQILTASGFTKTIPVQVDSTSPVGQLIGTNPPAGQTVPVDTVIQMQVSRGNQFIMPDVRGMFWDAAEPRLRALGWTGGLDKGADVQNSGQRSAAVVTQSPAPGTEVNYDSRITLSFAS
jgi:serine/threonine-protein kinase